MIGSADAVGPTTHAPEDDELRALFVAYRGRTDVLKRLHLIDDRRFDELAEQYGEPAT